MTETHSISLTAKAKLFFTILTVISFFSLVSAISITEIELNPDGSDTGNEWAELYSSSDYNLDNHYLLNNDGDIFNLSGTFSGYKVIEFPKQFLDNSDESLELKEWNSTGSIDSTEKFKDSKDDDLTWSLCDNDWEFVDSSKGEESSCEDSSSSESDPSSDSDSNSTSSDSSSDSDSSSADTPSHDSSVQSQETTSQEQPQIQIPQPESNKITLTSKTVSEKSSSIQQKSQSPPQSFVTKEGIYQLWLPIAFSFLCIVIIILIVIKKL